MKASLIASLFSKARLAPRRAKSPPSPASKPSADQRQKAADTPIDLRLRFKVRPVTGKEKQVLIVEQHPLFRAMLAELLSQKPGLRVCGQADNIPEALKLITQAPPDVAIVDLTLTAPLALELVRHLKARNLSVPVLVLSTHEERIFAEPAVRTGARGYVMKQQPPATLLAAIQTVLAGGIYVSEQVSQMIMKRGGSRNRLPAPAWVKLLTSQEIEIFQLVGLGLASPQIARQLELPLPVVVDCRSRIQKKLGDEKAVALYQRAAKWVAENNLPG